MVAEQHLQLQQSVIGCSLAKISMVAERVNGWIEEYQSCSLAKISMVAELNEE